MVDAKETSKTGAEKAVPQEMFEAATDLVLAVFRGGAKGCGLGLRTLGEELERFGDQLKRTDR